MARATLLERLTGRGGPSAWRTATVREVIAETSHAKTLVLDVPGWQRQRAGQHLDVRLTAADGYQASRSYSIGSAPELDALEITVEEVPDGELSPWFVEEAQPGDQFEVRGPIGGHFTWSVDERGPLLLVAGGSGLVPLMAMLRHRAARASTVEAHLLVSTRSADDLLFADELRSLQPSEGLSVAITYTRAAPDGWDGFTGRVDADMLAQVAPPPTAMPRCFVCGPTPFVEHVASLLVDADYPAGDIHAERFGPTGG